MTYELFRLSPQVIYLKRITIFIGHHQVPLAPELAVLPVLACMVSDGGHPIVLQPRFYWLDHPPAFILFESHICSSFILYNLSQNNLKRGQKRRGDPIPQ